MSTTATGGVQSLHRSLDLLEVLEVAASHQDSPTLAELAGSVGLPAATVHRLLRTMVDRGVVRQRPDRRYSLGYRLVPLGSTAGSMLDASAHEVLADLVTDLGETANLAVLAGHRAQYIAQAPSQYSMRVFTQVGNRVALHCTGVGKAMLAGLGADLVDEVVARAGLPRRTENTLTTRRGLDAALARVRDLGYAVDEEEQELGVRCVAVPVSGAGVAMAVSVSGPLSRVTDAVVARAVPALQDAAGRLVPHPFAP